MGKYRFLILIVCMYCNGLIHAQNLSCTFLCTTTIPKDVENIEDVNIRNLVIKRLSSEKQTYSLKFSKGRLSFEKIVNNDVDNKMMKLGETSSIYLDFNSNTSVSQENILDRTFIIKDSIKTYNWNITSVRKTILGEECIKAVLKEDSDIIAYFTPDIPVNAGPAGYFGLPGLILQLNTRSKQYLMQEIKNSTKELSIEIPTKGKEITMKEFETLKKKKEESLGIDNAHKGGIKIIKM